MMRRLGIAIASALAIFLPLGAVMASPAGATAAGQPGENVGQFRPPHGAPAGCFYVIWQGGFGCASGFALVPQRGVFGLWYQTVWTLDWVS